MKIFLVRASLRDPSGAFLSLEGRQMIRAVAAKANREEPLAIDRIVTSRDAACVQTAELLADRVDFLGVIEAAEYLDERVPAQVAAPRILERGSAIAIIADEPLLSSLGAFLVGRPTFPQLDPAQISLIADRAPVWYLRANTPLRLPLNVA